MDGHSWCWSQGAWAWRSFRLVPCTLSWPGVQNVAGCEIKIGRECYRKYGAGHLQASPISSTVIPRPSPGGGDATSNQGRRSVPSPTKDAGTDT
ncbi:hypothetical protein EDB80DRAFT_15168 [Ilyonectria destructans]|nr:hypothetical protein EDB80DRAFT_15168 [Ilyonectria destructans]